MYRLKAKKFITFGLIAIAILTILAIKIDDYFNIGYGNVRLAVTVTTVFTSTIIILFGPTNYWAPWRVLWRWFPKLNQWLFPDLNGIWVGSISSNWPIIKRMSDAASSEKIYSDSEFNTLELTEQKIVMEIKETLFSVSIYAEIASTGNSSHSITATARNNPVSGELQILYIYCQDTIYPGETDESSHLGAGELNFQHENLTISDGYYWTRRMWQRGFNTAGRISIEKMSESRISKKSLSEYISHP